MCLQVSVILFTGGVPDPGGAWSGGGCLLPEGLSAPGRVHGLEGCLLWGFCSRGVYSWGVPSGDPRAATDAGGTHPTGMHSCL